MFNLSHIEHKEVKIKRSYPLKNFISSSKELKIFKLIVKEGYLIRRPQMETSLRGRLLGIRIFLEKSRSPRLCNRFDVARRRYVS